MATITIKFKDTLTNLPSSSINVDFLNNGQPYSWITFSNGCMMYGIMDWFDDDQKVYDSTSHWLGTSGQYITIDTNQTNFNAFITAMKDNIEGVLLESGTYKWVDVPNLETGVMDVNISFTSNNAIWNYIHTKKGVIAYTVNAEWSGIFEVGWNTVSWSNDNLKTITIETDQYIDYDFYNYAILGNQLVKQTQPAYSFKHWKKSNVKVNKTGNLYFKPYTILGLYTITTTLTSCQASPTNVDRIEENSSVTLYFSKITSSYVLPDSVEVTNATYTWDKDTGALALSNPTGDISITITAVEALPQLATPTNVAVTDTTLTFDEVENATSYEVFVDNVSIGTYIGSKTLTLPTSTELGVSVDGYSVAQGDISVSEGVYNAITALNNGGSLTDFGNTCGLTIPSTQVKYFNMGLRLIAGDDVEIVDGKYRATIIVPTLTSQNDDNVYLIEFDYTNNTATYTAISVEDVDVVNHLIVCDFEKADGSTLLLLCYGGG